MTKNAFTSKRLVIPQLLAEDFSENYFVIDFSAGAKVTEFNIDTSQLVATVIDRLKQDIGKNELPYGFSEYIQLARHFIHPHSITGDSQGNIYTFYKQVPYFRKINLLTGTNELLPLSDDYRSDSVFPSTASLNNDGNFYLSVNSFSQRIQKYNSSKLSLDFKIYCFDTAAKNLSSVSDSCDGLIDNIHQVGFSEEQFLVIIDMNLSPDYMVQPEADYLTANFGREYSKHVFPRGKIFIYDLKTNTFIKLEPPLPTIAHAEFDPEDQSVFYVSCHNMSKIKTSMILHGPGAIIKYQYNNGVITELGSFSAPDFHRITTHKPFIRNGKKYMAVNGYPNFLFIIDLTTMQLASKIKLFERTETVNFGNGIYICRDDSNVSLYLEVSEDGRYVFMPTSQLVYVVDLETESVVTTIRYTEKNCIPTSHVALV